ncbi:hypothetical protein EOL73_02080 [Candidatus Saccharibacteria bacterium]|nr:hypothetical protein [Candidatus Saccharibacteria bacterium]
MLYFCSINSSYAIIYSRMIKQQKAHGFTVIEVMIFLSISGLLIMIAFMGTSSSISRTRFTDAMRTTQAFMQQQYSDVQNGLNLRTETFSTDSCGVGINVDPGTGDCLIVGKLVTFDPSSGNQIVVYPVISDVDPVVDSSMNEAQVLGAYNLRIAQNSKQYFDLPWQIKIIRSCDKSKIDTITNDKILGDCDGAIFDSYLILRSPRSGAIETYIFDEGWNLVKGPSLQLVSLPSSGYIDYSNLAEYRSSGNICFESPDLGSIYGGIQVGGRSSVGQLGNTMTSDMDKPTMEAVCGI